MDFSNFHQRAMEKLQKEFEDEKDNQNEHKFEDEEGPSTPTQSEFDTFQVLSNSNLVDFKKEKFSSKSLSPIASFGKDSQFDGQEEEEFSELQKHVEHPTLFEEQTPPRKYQEMNTPIQGDSERTLEPPYIRPDPTFAPKKLNKMEVLSESQSINTELEEEIEYEKQALLEELQSLQKQGSYTPIKNLTLKDTLEEIQFQYDRVQNDISTSQGVQMVISGIKMGSSILETLLKKFGFLSVDGFSQNLCKDPAKFNRPVTKLYKRYWRKGNMSPEAELSMIILGSLAWTIVQNKMQSPFSSSLEPKNLSAASIPESFSNPTKTTNGLNSYGNQENTTMYHPAPPKVNLQQFLEPPRLQAPQALPPSHQHTQQPVVIPRSIQGVSPPSSLAKKTESKKTITLGSRNSSINSASTKKKSMLKL
jgi:hypothetical protein